MNIGQASEWFRERAADVGLTVRLCGQPATGGFAFSVRADADGRADVATSCSMWIGETELDRANTPDLMRARFRGMMQSLWYVVLEPQRASKLARLSAELTGVA